MYFIRWRYRPDNDLPDYGKSHFLTFDCIELKKGDRVRVYTCNGEDCEETGRNTGARYVVVYWNLPAAIWQSDNCVNVSAAGDAIEAQVKAK